MPGVVPLVGRATELAEMSGRLRDTPLPSAVLAGPAGVGKTRLAAEVALVATSMGLSTAHVAATRAAASIPFGPFASLLPDADLAAGGLLDLLRGVGDSIIERFGQGKPLLLVVDDAHLLDDASAALLHQLAERPTVGLLVTIRTPGEVPDPITALWKDGLADRLDLGPLDEVEVDEFASGVLGGPVAGAGVRTLWELSGGNALYLRELIRAAEESGALADHDGIWILRRPPAAPERLTELLGSRLADLPADTVDVVDYLAVAGSLGYAVLEQLTSSAAAEDAERRGLIQVVEDGRRFEARLAHPMYGEVRRHRLPRARLRRLRADLANAIQATGGHRREDLLRLASWQLDAGQPGDPEMLTRAAKRARAMYDMDLAARLATAAYDAGGGVDAGLVLAVTHFATGAHSEADRLLAELTDRCVDDEERSAIANARAYNRSILMGDPDGALAVLDAAMTSIADPNARLTLSARAASISLFAGDPAAALAAVGPALDSDDDEVASRGYYVASTALALIGRNADAVAVAERALEVHRRCVEPTQIPEVQLIGATLGYAGAGALAEAETAALTAYNACLEAGDREGMATFSLLAGGVRIDQGKLVGAARAFREAAAINRELSDTGALRWSLGGLAIAEGMARNNDAAAGAIAELDQLRSDWMHIFSADLVERGRAWALVAAGSLTAARQTLRAATTQANAQGQRVTEARLLHDLAKLGEPGTVRDRLAELATLIDGDFVSALADHAAALHQRNAADLESVATRFADLTAYLLAAGAAMDASAAYLEANRSRQASVCARIAEEYAALTGAELPGRADTPDVERLTDREREIAGLAASGSSSKDIAASLFISQRTVDNHLQRIYSKLGVNGRDQLRAVLNPGN